MIQIKEFMAEKMEFGKHISVSKKSKKLFLALFATLLIVAAIVGVVTGVNSRKNSGNNQLSAAAHAVLKSSCSSTLYPDLCYSAIANAPGASAKLASQKDVIEALLNLTTEAIEHNYFAIKKLIKTRKISPSARRRLSMISWRPLTKHWMSSTRRWKISTCTPTRSRCPSMLTIIRN
jgi:pectinesterase